MAIAASRDSVTGIEFEGEAHGKGGEVFAYADRKMVCANAGDAGSHNPIPSDKLESEGVYLRRGIETFRSACNFFLPSP